jgi:hypothetical protein
MAQIVAGCLFSLALRTVLPWFSGTVSERLCAFCGPWHLRPVAAENMGYLSRQMLDTCRASADAVYADSRAR